MNTMTRVQLSVMMFIQFFIWGAWYVSMGVYMGELHFEAKVIGWAYSSTAWAAIITPFFMGMIADRFFPAQIVLGVLHLAGAVLMFLVSRTTEPMLFFFLLLGYACCYMPTLALTSSISFNQMKSTQDEFPLIRVLGTVGWIVAGLLISYLKVDATARPMEIAAGVSLLMGLYSFTLPNTPARSAGKKSSVREILGVDAFALFKDRSFAVFMVSALLICIPLSFYYGFGARFLAEGGVQNITAKMSMGQMSEFFFMLVIPFFFARLGVKYMLAVGMGAWVLRYLLFAFGAAAPLPMLGMWYLGILLHGVCYDFFFVTGQIYMDKRAPKELQSSAQGLFALFTFGIGMTIGTVASGQVVSFFTKDEVIQWRAVWLTPALLALAVLAVFFALFNEKSLPEEKETGKG